MLFNSLPVDTVYKFQVYSLQAFKDPSGQSHACDEFGLRSPHSVKQKMTKQLFSLIIIAMFSYPLAVLRTDCKISD